MPRSRTSRGGAKRRGVDYESLNAAMEELNDDLNAILLNIAAQNRRSDAADVICRAWRRRFKRATTKQLCVDFLDAGLTCDFARSIRCCFLR